MDIDEELTACVQENGAVGDTSFDTEFLAKVATKFNILLRCYHCRTGSRTIPSLVFCRSCGKCFHVQCWQHAQRHIASEFESDPCQKFSNLGLHLWTSHLHDADITKAVLLDRLEDDQYHKWIGIAPSEIGKPQKAELHVFSALTQVFQGQSGYTKKLTQKKYPRLISFFGDTGTGKSTVIKNLSQILNDPFQQKREPNNVPAAGSKSLVEDSTTSGIHLYADPQTESDPRPILYADCEGPGGSAPLAGRLRANSAHDYSRRGSELVHRVLPGGSRNPLQNETSRGLKPKKVSSTSLAWADRGSTDWPNEVASLLYPRFLYIFSDVVCFVSRQIKSAEHDMARLIDWAKNAHDWTTNQGTRPALIYIINRENLADSGEWSDLVGARNRIMEKLKNSTRFESERLEWKARLRNIRTADQLLLCYYSSISVIFIPEFITKNPSCEASEMQEQYQQLYHEILTLSAASAKAREQTGLLFESEDLARHSITVLDELAKDREVQLDLHKLAIVSQAHPNDFPSHVLNMLSRLRQNDKKTSEQALIAIVSAYIATCVAGEVVRRGSDTVVQNQHLAKFREDWKAILTSYSKTHCRCEAQSLGERCKNFEIAHLKGHQFQSNHGVRVEAGEFKSAFIKQASGLAHEFDRQLADAKQTLRGTQWQKTWKRAVRSLARVAGLEKIQSNRTCLTCLCRTPVHVLPCAHSVCNSCAEDFCGPITRNQHVLRLSECPLGCSWRDFTSSEWIINNKPKEAGVRILSLDGGGIRGMIELTLMRAIVDRIKEGYAVELHIQDLFDVVLGTSTGGIIALGIFKLQWSISDAMKEFSRLAHKAFSHRSLLSPFMGMSLCRFVAKLICTYLYRSEGIEEALISAFGQTYPLLGGEGRRNESERCKVAVVAASDEERRPLLLANYNREWDHSGYRDDNLRREEEPAYDLKVWEAARCTSAAPTYFAPYFHKDTNRRYIDGAFERNNPVALADAERMAIWPNSNENIRDIVVSIGTGYETNFEGIPTQPDLLSEKLQSLQWLGIVSKYAMLRLVVLNTTNCQKMWDDFKNGLARDKRGERDRAKCHRLNVPFGKGKELPKLDQVDEIQDIEKEAQSVLDEKSKALRLEIQEQLTAKVGTIARQLVATLFYLEMADIKQLGPNSYRCEGLLRCRLPASAKTSAEHLIAKQPTFRLYVLRQDSTDCTSLEPLSWNKSTLSTHVQFTVADPGELIRICISFDGGRNEEDISGYPRRLQESREI